MKLKSFTLTICCAIITATAFSQPTIVKQKTMGGNIDDYLQDFNFTNDGGVSFPIFRTNQKYKIHLGF